MGCVSDSRKAVRSGSLQKHMTELLPPKCVQRTVEPLSLLKFGSHFKGTLLPLLLLQQLFFPVLYTLFDFFFCHVRSVVP